MYVYVCVGVCVRVYVCVCSVFLGIIDILQQRGAGRKLEEIFKSSRAVDSDFKVRELCVCVCVCFVPTFMHVCCVCLCVCVCVDVLCAFFRVRCC